MQDNVNVRYILLVLPPGRLFCCLGGSAAPSETNVGHFQRNFYPPAHSWQPWSTGLQMREYRVTINLFLYVTTTSSLFAWAYTFSTPEVGIIALKVVSLNGIDNKWKAKVFCTWLVRMYSKHGWEHLADLAFGGLMSKRRRGSLGAHKDNVFDPSCTQSSWQHRYIPISYRKQHVRATAAHHPVGKEDIGMMGKNCNDFIDTQLNRVDMLQCSTFHFFVALLKTLFILWMMGNSISSILKW